MTIRFMGRFMGRLAAPGMETLLSSMGRYTKFVRSTKLVLCVLVSALTGVLLYYSLMKNDNAGIRIALTTAKKALPAPTQMHHAQYHGLGNDNQPYNLLAENAIQRDENQVDLVKPSGDMTLQSGAWLSLTANNGIFRLKDKWLDLEGMVQLFDDEGDEFRMNHLHIELGAKQATTQDEVKGQGPTGHLTAKGGARIDNGTGVVTFYGPVFVTLYPQATQGPPMPAAPGSHPDPLPRGTHS